VLLIVGLIAGTRTYVHPQIDPLRHADAIFVLGGYGADRYSYGLELAKQGWAPELVASNAQIADEVWGSEFCATPPPWVNVECFEPYPDRTFGEARELRRLALERGWHTVIVVTSRAHVSRARFILERCFDGDLVTQASPLHIPMWRWVFEYVYQTAGYIRALSDQGC
jgi:uncharacterized SAM-binding protein YcdF (DUF218 family)